MSWSSHRYADLMERDGSACPECGLAPWFVGHVKDRIDGRNGAIVHPEVRGGCTLDPAEWRDHGSDLLE